MPKQIEIQDSDVEALIEFFKGKETTLLDGLKSVRATLAQLTGEGATLTTKTLVEIPQGYDVQATWQNKIEFFLKPENNDDLIIWLTTSQLVERILNIESDKRGDRKKVVASVSAVLSTNSKEDGSFVKRINARNENEFTLSSNLNKKAGVFSTGFENTVVESHTQQPESEHAQPVQSNLLG